MRSPTAVQALVAVSLVALVAACGGAQQTQAPTRSPAVPTRAPAQPTAGATGAGGGTQVAIENFAFSPASIEVQVGDTVTWTNNDGAPHTVTFDEGPDSGELGQGDTFEHTFETAGEFEYICEIHPSMRGSVSVSP